MDLIPGGFHEVEKDGKLYLVYYHPKYRPIPQTQTTSSSDPLLFLCPYLRCFKNMEFFLVPSPEYDLSRTPFHDPHHLIPFFDQCNEEAFRSCSICFESILGTDHYYFCKSHKTHYHRDCVESPFKIKHPYHPDHTLQLSYRPWYTRTAMTYYCLYCGRGTSYLFYHCTTCQVSMHPVCAMKPIPFVIDPPKNHIHSLTFFPRQASLICNICGSLREKYPTYLCFRCNFVAHIDCMNYPHIIKISRHNHRISLTLSLPSRKWSCRVCRLSVNNDYGGYTCDKCSDLVVHPVCATGKKVWDGVELEGVLDDDDITQDDGPFEIMSQGVILHFLLDHHPLRLGVSIFYDENKICQACALPIYEGNFYSWKEKDKYEFIVHEKCANAPRRIQHALHSHPLTLRKSNNLDEWLRKSQSITYKWSYQRSIKSNIYSDAFWCNACDCVCGAFLYECQECRFRLDLRCASISEPFDCKGHEDPLFLALDPEVNPRCHLCQELCIKQLNCIKCDFIVCFRCVTLPYKAKYKHDPHFLTFSYGEKVSDKDWCEVCERNLKDTDTKLFYWCDECNTIVHIECLFGEDRYTLPGQRFYAGVVELYTNFLNNNLSRPLCNSCGNHCQRNIYKGEFRKYTACSLKCIEEMSERT